MSVDPIAEALDSAGLPERRHVGDAMPERRHVGDAMPERRRLGDVLVEHDLITREQLNEALDVQRRQSGKHRKRLGRVIVEMGFLTERQVAQALAELLALELIDGGDLAVSMEVARLLPRQVAERAHVLVLGRTNEGLRVATADPTNAVALDDVRAYTGSNSLSLVVATESMIQEHIARVYAMAEDSKAAEAAGNAAEDAMLAKAADQAPTVQLVQQILSDAVRLSASDVHIEQQHDGVWVRMRIDGVLHDISRVPRGAASALVSRLKIVSSMDVAERRLPQDGRMKIDANGVAVDARVSTMPAVLGEKVVIRILPDAAKITTLEGLGMEPQQLKELVAAASSAQGLVLITGPPGSGKTNTLYSVLSHLSDRTKSVTTLEDPVEIQLPGITQVQINEPAGLTFARGLRSMLRQDPDVVLVGEVRDSDTAQLALEASSTGHLVLTTLHTNNVAAAVIRLVEMGAEPFLVASSVTLVVAQRLMRVPCASCAQPYRPPAQVLEQLGVSPGALEGATPKRGLGCTECHQSGYRGRVGVFEVLPVTQQIRETILKTPTEVAVAHEATASGIMSLRHAALTKAWRGETTFEEVARLT